ncbi:ABC transporter permease [Frigoribacterium sp. ACAM 257]|uniref:ABC transporter permease n=1 Tax=Frigoribacterium sp. ACAM 257 TaxID=2508998 RepID=UPI0011B9879D|nr:ABC transporter permease [Frigoribacterium sp. ACAM 257]TWX40261.1 ABC transporter permease [Frigoribacterium sp. ACAM 257]
MSYISELVSSRELLANLTMREVKGKYRRTVFGQLWSLINPLATMLVYTIVFAFIFRARIVTGDPSGLTIYPLWLMAGLLPWTFFTRVVNGSMASIVSNGSLIKKVYFPRMNLPLSTVGSVGFTWLLEMGVLSVALLIAGAFVLPWLPVVVLAMMFLALFAVGLGMMLAIANVHFRDMQHFVGIVLQMWMYLTPIIYPVSLVADAAENGGRPWILTLYRLNPLERFVEVFRNLLYDTRWPDFSDSLYCVLASLIVFTLGFLVFSRNEKKLAELL